MQQLFLLTHYITHVESQRATHVRSYFRATYRAHGAYPQARPTVPTGFTLPESQITKPPKNSLIAALYPCSRSSNMHHVREHALELPRATIPPHLMVHPISLVTTEDGTHWAGCMQFLINVPSGLRISVFGSEYYRL